MRKITEAIVHCTATRPEWWASRSTSQKVKEVTRWHVEDRGWSACGYHFLIDRDGTVAKGRPIERDGAHVRGHNTGTIGVSLFGGHGSSQTDRFEDHFTPEQEHALRELLDELKAKYGFTKVSAHSDFANKACPGFDFHSWYRRKAPRSSLLSSTTLQAAGVSGVGVVGSIASIMSALGPREQTIVLVGGFVVLAGLAWVARERIRRWGQGVR